MGQTLLEIENLEVSFQFDTGWHKVIRGVDLVVGRGRILGIIGESGSGKTVTLSAVLGLLDMDIARIGRGRALYGGTDLLKLKEWQRAGLRGSSIGFVFQSPHGALNPYRTVGSQIKEVYTLHGLPVDRQAIGKTLESVGIIDPEAVLNMYPDQLSGGMAQRVLIGMTTLLEPDLIIADEPTSAIDASLRKMVLDVVLRVNGDLGSTLVLITHDFDVVAYACDDVAVMYGGMIMETGPVEDLMDRPWHPYTRGVMDCAESLSLGDQVLVEMKGNGLDARKYTAGCPFAPRCDQGTAICHREVPDWVTGQGRGYRCHHPRGWENHD